MPNKVRVYKHVAYFRRLVVAYSQDTTLTTSPPRKRIKQSHVIDLKTRHQLIEPINFLSKIQDNLSKAQPMTLPISIIIPIYNTEKYLQQCLDSIAAQTFTDFEALCIDDGSTDNSSAIIDAFASKDGRFKAVHKKNAGYGSAVNVGLNMASGAYIGIVEPDDYIEPNMYETLYSSAKENSSPDIVKSAYWRVLNADSPQQEVKPANYLHRIEKVNTPFKLDDDAEFLYHHPSIWSAIYKRGFLENNGIRMPEIPGAGWADNPWMMETLLKAQSIVYVDECLYFYRETIPGSSSVVKDPSIIYNRWFDMDKILKQNLPVSSGVLEGHYNRGCAYLEELGDRFDSKDSKIKNAKKRMVGLIDSKVVSESDNIRPEYKKAFFETKNPLAWTWYRLKRKLSRYTA